MILNESILIIILIIFLLLFLIVIKEVKSRAILLDGGNNPWAKEIRLYDIEVNHGRYVIIDMPYGYPEYVHNSIGQCPVFGKTIAGRYEEIVEKESGGELTKEIFLSDYAQGSITHGIHNNSKLWFEFPTITDINSEYKHLISPVKTATLNDCVTYAQNLEHLIIPSNTNKNCQISPNKGICIKHPFQYNFVDKTCRLYYTGVQHLKQNKSYSYNPIKIFAPIVFGTSFIDKNWMTKCPIKIVKGAIFGEWINNKCEPFNKPIEFNNSNRKNCVEKFYDLISYHNVFWGFFTDNKCKFVNLKPDCFYYDKDGYSFTLLSIPSTIIYDLPPCIQASENWVIDANCIDGFKRTYKCLGGYWVANDNIKIKKCETRIHWATMQNFMGMNYTYDVPDIDVKYNYSHYNLMEEYINTKQHQLPTHSPLNSHTKHPFSQTHTLLGSIQNKDLNNSNPINLINYSTMLIQDITFVLSTFLSTIFFVICF